MVKQIFETKTFLEKKGIKDPELGVVLGTGLGKLIQEISIITEIDYGEIPNFVRSTVESHPGKLIFGTINGKKILAMQGRFHYYEGYNMQQITFPIRVMKAMGVNKLLLSNAAGAINPSFKKGTLMLLDDHINLLPENPLRGNNEEELGPRFPDMSEPYSSSLNSILLQCAEEEGVCLHKGVYASVQGPNLETRAEYRFLKTIGADAVGMSTVPEVIVANHMRLPCAAISVLTDECDPDNLKKVGLNEILATASKAEDTLVRIFNRFIKKLA